MSAHKNKPYQLLATIRTPPIALTLGFLDMEYQIVLARLERDGSGFIVIKRVQCGELGSVESSRIEEWMPPAS